MFVAVKDVKENISFIYLKMIWEREKFVAETLHSRSMIPSKYQCSDIDLEEAEKNISFFLGREIKLDETQKQAIRSVFENRISVITGGGGTGKSTICRCIYFLARKKNLTVNMMSPTGKAAKVLSERTGGTATTIHRGLGIGPDDVLPSQSIEQEILLVDEISMAGIDTMYALMVAIESNPRANIVFVGDKNQLPSVSPGNFLSDIIKSDCANVVTLDRIHRQDEDSYISLIANDIAKGIVTMIPDNAKDITWTDLNNNTIEKEIVEFVDDYIKDGDIEDLQILSPMKNGSCGVNKLNEIVQQKMATVNGQTGKVLEREFKKFHIGDRVIQTKNNYEKEVFNGDMGFITDLGERIQDPKKSDRKEKFITIDFGDREVFYYGKDIDEVMVAWVITVHKFQGSQSKDVIMMLSSEASIMMNKELVYTGFTRAEKHLYIYGSEQMYRLAPSKSAVKRRFTNLNNLIKQLKTGEKILKVS
jgi:exodeoxyribonuclease V alpha subunit